MGRSQLATLLCPALLVLVLSCLTFTRAQTQTSSFPCPTEDLNSPTQGSNAPGSYQNLNLDTLESSQILEIVAATNASWLQWVDTEGNATACNNTADIDSALFTVAQVCSQVVAGTNLGIKFLVDYTCAVDGDTLAEDRVVLNAVVFVPLSSNSANGQEPETQVTSVSQDPDYPVEQLVVDLVPADTNEDVAAAPTTPTSTAAPPPTAALRSFGTLDGLGA